MAEEIEEPPFRLELLKGFPADERGLLGMSKLFRQLEVYYRHRANVARLSLTDNKVGAAWEQKIAAADLKKMPVWLQQMICSETFDGEGEEK